MKTPMIAPTTRAVLLDVRRLDIIFPAPPGISRWALLEKDEHFAEKIEETQGHVNKKIGLTAVFSDRRPWKERVSMTVGEALVFVEYTLPGGFRPFIPPTSGRIPTAS